MAAGRPQTGGRLGPPRLVAPPGSWRDPEAAPSEVSLVDAEAPRAGEYHLRGISVTLTMLDEALGEIEEWAHGRARRSILYQERNRLTRKQREGIRAEVQHLRALLRELSDHFGLEPTVEDAAQAIRASCAALWQYLVETEAKHLRRYGDLPPGLGEYLDPKVEELIEGMQRISDTARGG